ncbi:pyridoxamine 5'-phosphate oxidase family protein [Streptomyces capparidis]
MTSVYHPGERAVQHRAGATEAADHVGRSVRETIPAVAAAFLAERRTLVVGAADPAGRVWASLLTGPPGFLHAGEERTLDVAAAPPPGDPLAAALAAGPHPVGTLALDPARRRRMRLNGTARPRGGGLRIETAQVYANCPKYIQRRDITGEEAPAAAPPRTGTELTLAQQLLVSTADTFFISTADGATGAADASHRGGAPGFVEVLDGRRLRWPEYPGNNMFMTLGNLHTSSRTGLLVVDWATGTTLQLTGEAAVRWEGEGTPHVHLTVTGVVERPGGSPLRWTDY